MRRLTTAPNLALASLWSDLLRQAGVGTSIQRAFASSIAGELPPDQALPELWLDDADEFDRALALLDALRHPTPRHWLCPQCRETIDGPFESCWSCGCAMP